MSNRFTPVIVAAGLCILLPWRVVATEPPKQGIIRGRLVWAEKDIPKPRDLFTPTPQPVLSEDIVVDPKSRGLANTFAFIAGTGPAPLASAGQDVPRVVLDQKDYRFVPHALAVHNSQTLVIRSSDPLGHNARSSGRACIFNVMVGPAAEIEIRLQGRDSRVQPVACDIHSWMRGVLMIFDHPYFDVSRPDGRFELRDVPAGPRRLVLLHEKLGYLDPSGAKGREVLVKPAETVDLGDIPIRPRPDLQLKAAP